MYFRKVVMLNLFASLTMSQEQLGSDIDGEAAGSMALAQGITLPSEPSQAPIGGLGWLAALGGALAYNKLRKK